MRWMGRNAASSLTADSEEALKRSKCAVSQVREILSDVKDRDPDTFSEMMEEILRTTDRRSRGGFGKYYR